MGVIEKKCVGARNYFEAVMCAYTLAHHAAAGRVYFCVWHTVELTLMSIYTMAIV